MGDQAKSLRKENEELKKQLFEVQKDLKSIKKGATANKQHGGSRSQPPLLIPQPNTALNENDVKYLSGGYDEPLAKVNGIASNVDQLSKAIDDMQLYSY